MNMSGPFARQKSPNATAFCCKNWQRMTERKRKKKSGTGFIDNHVELIHYDKYPLSSDNATKDPHDFYKTH